MTADPFTVLGLPVRPDLTDDDVRAAWRRIAALTHPDREDGGDPERFALAAAAYTELRTRYGRGEAHANLIAGGGRRARSGRRRRYRDGHGQLAALVTRAGGRLGRPVLFALRVAIAAGISVAAFAVTGLQPASAGLATGALTWLLLTSRHDFAPPGS